MDAPTFFLCVLCETNFLGCGLLTWFNTPYIITCKLKSLEWYNYIEYSEGTGMKKKTCAFICFLLSCLLLAACSNAGMSEYPEYETMNDLPRATDEITLDYVIKDDHSGDDTAYDSTYVPDIVEIYHYVRGRVISIDGIEDESWIVPEKIDWIRFRLECDGSNIVSIVMLRRTVRHGTLAVGSYVTAYWPENSPVFMPDVPTYVAFIVVADGAEYECLAWPFWWELYNDVNIVRALCLSYPIKVVAFPETFSWDRFEVLPIPIIAYGIELEEQPITMEDGTIMVPFQSSVRNISDSLGRLWITACGIFDDWSFTMSVSCGSIAGGRGVAVGSTTVCMWEPMVLCTPPIVVEGIVYVPLLSFFRDTRPFIDSSAVVYSDRVEIMLIDGLCSDNVELYSS